MNNLLIKLKSQEVASYIVVGICTTAVNFIAFTILCKFLKIDITISNIISVMTSILFAYVTNKIFVFKSHCQDINELFEECFKFISARFLTMIVEVGGLYLLVNVIGQEELIGKFETQILVLVGNYLISKFIVFRN